MKIFGPSLLVVGMIVLGVVVPVVQGGVAVVPAILASAGSAVVAVLVLLALRRVPAVGFVVAVLGCAAGLSLVGPASCPLPSARWAASWSRSDCPR